MDSSPGASSPATGCSASAAGSAVALSGAASLVATPVSAAACISAIDWSSMVSRLFIFSTCACRAATRALSSSFSTRSVSSCSEASASSRRSSSMLICVGSLPPPAPSPVPALTMLSRASPVVVESAVAVALAAGASSVDAGAPLASACWYSRHRAFCSRTSATAWLGSMAAMVS